MSFYLDKPRWTEVFKGQLIIDIAIRQKDVLQILLRENVPHEKATLMMDHEIPLRIISLFLNRPAGDNCGFQELTGMQYPVLGVSREPFERPGGIVVAKNQDGDAWPFGGGNGPMEKIAPGKIPGCVRLKCLNGYTYSIGIDRTIYKRVAVGRWEPFVTKGLKFMNDIPGLREMPTARMLEITGGFGFSDMDAFSDSDVYAVGGNGDVWHFDGSAWQQMGFPSNVQLGTVTCAGDGNVYISGEGGSLWVGRKSTWKRVYEGSSSILWNDVLWFEGKLWLASDYQFRIWDGQQMQPVTHEGKSVNMYGHMDVFDGLLAIASPEWVETFDGQQWRKIVGPYLE
jgi:hypothetical protein